MTFNPIAPIVLIVGIALTVLGSRLARAFEKSFAIIPLTLAAIILAIPAVLFTLYYDHLFDSWSWFYQFRSIPHSELSASGIGLLSGMSLHWCKKLGKIRFVLRPLILLTVIIIVIIPYLKLIIAPIRYDKIRDKWDGNVCKQSAGYTCGPASAATILKHFRISATEAELAKECFTSSCGTENWYLARALRRRGLSVTFYTSLPSDGLPLPCIAGVRFGVTGHFIAVLPAQNEQCIIADPLHGARLCSGEKFFSECKSTGFFMKVEAGR